MEKNDFFSLIYKNKKKTNYEKRRIKKHVDG